VRSAEERDRLVEQYLPLVRYVVARLPVTMPASLDRDDFFSVGVIGLMHAASTFDPTRGASFKTFAYTAVRGAILDEVRKHDPVPRSS
jgi:RNA polymerase sigma factor for flagellar operon FliA